MSKKPNIGDSDLLKEFSLRTLHQPDFGIDTKKMDIGEFLKSEGAGAPEDVKSQLKADRYPRVTHDFVNEFRVAHGLEAKPFNAPLYEPKG